MLVGKIGPGGRSPATREHGLNESDRLALYGGTPALLLPGPAWPLPDDGIRLALERAWADGSWGQYDGPHVKRLAELLAEMHQVRHALPCSSGTVAVELALRGLQIGPGDEVILAGYDFSGNFRAIEAVGARPVLVDIGADHWCLDAERVAEAVTPDTRGVVVSHLHGTLADMRRLVEVARQHHLVIVEDACQVPGATVQGRVAGGWGHAAVLSFGGSKLLTAGRGGAVLTQDDLVYQRMKIYCERGNHAFPLSELQGAVLPPQIRQLAARNRVRQASVERLVARLAAATALRPVRDTNAENVTSYYKLGFQYDPAAGGNWPREQFLAALQAEGVPCDAGFRGFARRGAGRCRQSGSLAHSRQAAESLVLLHHPILLQPAATVDGLAAAILKVERHARQLGASGLDGQT
jgi:perosamine synthetase